jgi:hypothetical protein
VHLPDAGRKPFLAAWQRGGLNDEQEGQVVSNRVVTARQIPANQASWEIILRVEMSKGQRRGSNGTEKSPANAGRNEGVNMQPGAKSGTATDGRLRKRRHVKIALPTTATLDMRTRAGRLYKATREAIIADLGGRDELSRAELELIDRAAGLATRLSAADAEMLEGTPPSLGAGEYATLANSLNRILTTIGLKRRPRDVTPDLRTYLASRAIEKQAAA